MINMAAKTTDNKTQAKTTKTPKKTGKVQTKKRTRKTVDGDEESPISKMEVTQWCISGALIITALLLMVSFVSNIFTGAEDQKYLQGSVDSAANWLGGLGAFLVRHVMERSFGLPSIILPVFMVAVSFRILGIGKIRIWKWTLNCIILMTWFSVFGAYLQHFFFTDSWILLGGMHGKTIVDLLTDKVGPVGTFLIIVVTAVIYLGYLSGEGIRTISRIIDAARERANKEGEEEDDEVVIQDGDAEGISNHDAPEEDTDTEDEVPPLANVNTATTIEFDPEAPNPLDNPEIPIMDDTPFEVNAAAEPAPEEQPGEETNIKVVVGEDEPEADLDNTGALEPYDPKLDLSNYKYPTLNLLKKYDIDTHAVDMEEQKKNKNQILTVLSNFGVEISSIKATVGPTITLYEITPAPGVRISKIRNLEDDIALSLSALGIRIIAPIPGKGTIGIEVPNAKPQMVSMESIINSRKFQETDYELPMALGKTITNEIYMVDLAKMPHLLVAGATGQGKSVGLNAILTSLLYKKHPAELKLVMVDPKKVEFSVYNPIVNHFLAQVEGNEDTDEPIITDVNKVVQTLKSLCQEMDTRYDLLKKARARNIKEYNEKFKERRLNPENGHKFMPYIVVIIDEFGDLIMTAGKEIELPIARIAQLARAVGIHMIIATQRPTTNIITGTIKANFPARMAFKVSAMIDSRTILDRPGANQLVGKGDMLFLAGNDPVRVQCAFVDTPEVERICSHIACQQSYLGPFQLPRVESEGDSSEANDVDMHNLDPMFEEVARLVVSSQQGSTSMIQRKFAIGYNRAGRLMDQLEKAGIVGPAQGSKPREVLVMGDIELDQLLCNLH